MVDFSSNANISCLKEGLEKISTKYMYIRADHDNYLSWLSPDAKEQCQNLQNEVCSNDSVMYWEYDNFIVMGFNNSTSQLTEQGYQVAESVFQKKKPVILLTHVPFQSVTDNSLSEASKAGWNGKELMWGTGTSYVPKDFTSSFMEYVYNENTSVKEVLAGHLHFTWDGNITQSIHQHVFSPAYKGYIGVITIDNGK